MTGAVYLDLDGTLLDPGGVLTRDSLEAVETVRGAGLLPVVLTGRSRWVAQAIARTLGVRDVVCELGAVVLAPVGSPPLGLITTPVPRRELLRCLVDLPLEEHEPGAPRSAGVVVRSAATATDVTSRLAAAGFAGWWAVDNGPSHRPLADGRPARVLHLVLAGTDKTSGVSTHLLVRSLDAARCAVVGDSPADLACAAVVGRVLRVRSDDDQAAEAAERAGIATTDAAGAAGTLEAVRRLTTALAG